MPAIFTPPQTLPADWTIEEWDALVAALTRRKLIGGGLALGLLTACGAAAPATPTVPTTRSIETAMGRVNVPTNPQRIVCLDSYSVSDILDTNLTPVGIPEKMSGAVAPMHTALIPAITTVGAYGKPDLEKLAVLKPDLILAITIDSIKAVYDKLSAIAPTALFDYTVPDAWRALAEQFDEAAGRTASLSILPDHIPAAHGGVALHLCRDAGTAQVGVRDGARRYLAALHAQLGGRQDHGGRGDPVHERGQWPGRAGQELLAGADQSDRRRGRHCHLCRARWRTPGDARQAGSPAHLAVAGGG